MPDESCRNCGTELQIESICSECRQAIQQICPECSYATLERVHSDCTTGLEIMTVQELKDRPTLQDRTILSSK